MVLSNIDFDMVEDEQGGEFDSEYNIYNVDRPRGVLTPVDREYLLGVSDIEPKSQRERNRRADIRERVFHGLLDFVLLEHMEERDRNTVFSPEPGRTPNDSQKLAALEQGVIAALGFLYSELQRETVSSLEDSLQQGVTRAEATRDEEGEVHIRPYHVSLEIEEPEELSVKEAVDDIRRNLHRLSETEREQAVNLLRKRRNRDTINEEVLDVLRQGGLQSNESTENDSEGQESE